MCNLVNISETKNKKDENDRYLYISVVHSPSQKEYVYKWAA